MNELSFLIDLLLNHKLAKTTKEMIKCRIEDIAKALPTIVSPAAMAATMPTSPFRITSPEPPPVPPEQIAQTPAAQAALALRQQMMQKASKDGFSGTSAIKSHSNPPGPSGRA